MVGKVQGLNGIEIAPDVFVIAPLWLWARNISNSYLTFFLQCFYCADDDINFDIVSSLSLGLGLEHGGTWWKLKAIKQASR